MRKCTYPGCGKELSSHTIHGLCFKHYHLTSHQGYATCICHRCHKKYKSDINHPKYGYCRGCKKRHEFWAPGETWITAGNL